MAKTMQGAAECPDERAPWRLPAGGAARLQALLDRQDAGELLTPAERAQAEALVDAMQWRSLRRLRARHAPG